MGRVLTSAFLLAGTWSFPAGPSGTEETPDGTLYFFFSPATPSAPAAARALASVAKATPGKIRIRPVLLVENWKALKKPTEESPLYRTVRELGDRSDARGVHIPIFDEAGRRLARAWKLSRLPAFLLVVHGKAHVVTGSRLSLDELSECER